jgi:hypothetical protein
MKVAIVHDWLTVVGGGERVLEQLLTVYPEADLFTVVDFLSDEDRQIVHGKRAQTTFIQGLPFARKRYRHFLPLMPLATAADVARESASSLASSASSVVTSVELPFGTCCGEMGRRGERVHARQGRVELPFGTRCGELAVGSRVIKSHQEPSRAIKGHQE